MVVECDPGGEADPLRWSRSLQMTRSSAGSERAHVNAHFMKLFAQQAHGIMAGSMEKERWILPHGGGGTQMEPHVLKKQN